MAAAKETSVDAATTVVVSELDGIFTSKEYQGNGTQGLSRWTPLFPFTPDWLWREFC